MESNLNRSFSAPDITCEPVCRRVFMEEVYYPGNSPYPIRRQISYDNFPPQIAGGDIQSKFPSLEHKPTMRKNYPSYLNYTPTKNHSKHADSIRFLEYPQEEPSPINVDHFNDSPMDIDLDETQTEKSKPKHTITTSTPTIVLKTEANFDERKVDHQGSEIGLDHCKVSYRGGKPVLIKGDNGMAEAKEEMVRLASAGLKKKFRRLTKDQEVNPVEEKKSRSKKLPFALCVIIALALVPVYDHYNYNRVIDLEKIKSELRANVINQDLQLQQISEFLDKINTIKNKHVLTFIGTTGVGKTHCANIIKRAFKPQQIHEINLESFNLKNFNLHRDLPYLIILENLKYSDVDRVVLFLDALPVDKSLLILNIFNIQETENHEEYITRNEYFTEIPKLFEKSGYMIEAVKFNTFDRNTVMSNYDFLTRDRGVDKNFFLQTADEHNFEYSGLKKFFAKLNLS